MDDVLGYKGKSVVVTGAASGMGQATAKILVDLGASVTALDINPTTVPVAVALQIDLRDRANIEQVAASIDGPIDGLFSCAGLPGPPFSEWDTILVNFVGARHLAERVVPKMTEGSAISVISSSAAIGWQNHIPVISELLATKGFDGAVDWLREHETTVVMERIRVLEVHNRCLGGLVVCGPGHARHSNQLHQSWPYRNTDDAGVPQSGGQGPGRPGRRAGRSVFHTGGAGMAAGVPRQSAAELCRR